MINWFDGEYHFLSNFYESPVVFNGLEYGSAEAAYQAQKTANPEDRVQFTTLKAAQAKVVGRNIRMRPEWDAVKLGVMKAVLDQKFTDPTLAKWLVETGSHYLQEGNYWHDTFWGTNDGVGDNWLGRLLMLVRSELVLKK